VSDAPARLAAALADRYTIQRELGQGGMATVYLAEDLKHHRWVAIKVLRPELAQALGPERFLREIETTASLRHPHILPLHDSGEAAGFLYYVMPFVEGESLRDRLSRERQLPIEEALQIAREVADALSYAHGRQIVHRDIKPENILLESGHAVVADFGIARAVSAAGGARLTETGLAVGTVQYMSPEQAAGDQDLDGRSDLYALGCVLYEMLAGQPPFSGPTAESVVRQHMMAAPPPVAQLRPAVPPAVSAALERALAKTPADRFNPVAQFSDALRHGTGPLAGPAPAPPPTSTAPSRRRPMLVLGFLALLAIAAVLLWRRGAGAGRAEAASVAVLPFVDLSPDRASAYLGDGMAETLINALANVPGLSVAARTSAFAFRDKAEDVRLIGQELGVATVLEGSVQRSGERLRVTAQLVKTADGLHLWSQSFDRSTADIFAVQDEVARAVVTALKGQLLDRQPGPGPGTRDPAAYDAFLQGRFFWGKRTVADIDRAIGLFGEAIARDSTYAEAWAGLADASLTRPFYSLAPSADFLPKAREAAEHALALNPDLADAHTTLGYILAMYYWDWEGSEREIQRGIALNPKYALAHKWYTDVLMMLGRPEEAFREVQTARQLDPLSANILAILGEVFSTRGQDDSALVQYQKALDIDPAMPLALEKAEHLLWSRGEVERSFALRERLERVSPRIAVPTAVLRRAYAAGGRTAVLRAQLSAPADHRIPTDRASWHAQLGEFDSAFAELDRAFADRDMRLAYVTYFPEFAPLWGEPRFAVFLKKIGLPSTRWHRGGYSTRVGND